MMSLLAPLGFSLYVIFTVLYLSAYQYLCAAALLLGSLAFLYLYPAKWKIYVCAAALGMIGEYLCVARFNLWSYRFPVFFAGLPVWIGLVWGYLFAVFTLIAELLEPVWTSLAPALRRLLLVIFTLSFFIFFRHAVDKISIYISYYYVLFLSLSLALWRKPADALIFLSAGIGGTVGEYLSIQKGLWVYTHPAFPETGMPISLPMAWGFAGIFVRNAAGRFWHTILWTAGAAAVLIAAARIIPN